MAQQELQSKQKSQVLLSQLVQIKNTLLEKNNYSVIATSTEKECLLKLKTSKPDLLLMGGFLPRTKIFEATQNMNGTKIAYLITDDTYLGNDSEVYSNIIGFINEPVDIDKFLEKLKEYINAPKK